MTSTLGEFKGEFKEVCELFISIAKRLLINEDCPNGECLSYHFHTFKWA